MERKPWGMVNRGKSKDPFFPVLVNQNDENSMVPITSIPDGGAAAAPTFGLAQFAASLRGDALPRDIKVTLGDLFLDYLRVASIGAAMPWSAWADAYMAQLGGQGRAAVLFRPQRRE